MEILLSYFAIIGVILLISTFFDSFLYRKPKHNSLLILNFMDSGIEEIINTLELVYTVRKRAGGESLISRVVILIGEDLALQREIELYVKLFTIPAKIETVSDPITFYPWESS